VFVVCLWVAEEFSSLTAAIRRRESHSVCYWAFAREPLMDYGCVCVLETALMHDTDTIEAHFT